MKIIKRIKDIFSANANAALDKIEDPEKMIDQYIREAENTLGEVKAKTAEVMTIEEKFRKKIESCMTSISEMDTYAKKALSQGNAADVEQFLKRKLGFEDQLIGYEQALNVAMDNANNMRKIHDRLVEDLNSYKEKRDSLKSKIAVVKTFEKVNKIAGMSAKTSDALSNFSRMEEKIDDLILKGNALSQLEAPKDKIGELKSKYDSSSKDARLQEAVTALKYNATK